MRTNGTETETRVAPRLGLWDTVSIIVGIVVGTAIFRSPTVVFQNAGGPSQALGLWFIGGVLAWCGAVCYAELATTYPRDGGDYEYLSRAFGSWCGFLFGWAQLATVISGNIAIMAYAFADYSMRMGIWPWKEQLVLLVALPVVVLAVLNALGVVAGKVVQNLLSAAKVVGLLGLVGAGVWVVSHPEGTRPQAAFESESNPFARIGLALVFVLYAYGGWSHAAYVAAEVRDQRRNLPRALMLGIVSITVIYLAVNATYVAVLGYDGARHTATPAADVLEIACGPWGGRAISLLVMLSALGAINGMILTGTRIYAVWGADYRALAWLSAWNRRSVAPVAAIAAQTVIALALIALVGTRAGRASFDAVLRAFGLSGLPWAKYSGGFETLIAGSTPVFWLLTLLTGIALFVLRHIDRAVERPFTVPLYPLPLLAFCGTSAYMLWASVAYARWLSLIGFIPLALGAIVAFAVRPSRAAA
jgi:amino acid transporter